MRGSDEQTSGMFSYLSPEQRVRQDHPLRAIRRMTDEILTSLSPRFSKMYSDMGRPSIPPEQLLRALLLQSLYTVRSERLLMEEIDYSVLFRWFVGLGMDDPIWSPTTFSKNRDRLLQSDIAAAFFDAVVAQARTADLLSDEHFTVDGTLLEAGAGLKSFRKKDEDPPPPDDPGNPTVNFHGDTRRNDTHQSTTDPDARLARKGPGKEAEAVVRGPRPARQSPWFRRECLRDPRDRDRRARGGLADAGPRANGNRRGRQRLRRAQFRRRDARPGDHAARRAEGHGQRHRRSHHAACRLRGQPTETKIDRTGLGWMKTVGGLRKLRHRGGLLVDWIVTFTAAAYNLIRLRTLLARPA